MHAVKDLLRAGQKPALVKIDCMWTEDDARFKRLEVPVAVGLSKDMCPDHYAIYNFDEMLEWTKAQGSDILLNETAGLCLRCAPYPDKALAICVIDVTTGPNSPLEGGTAAYDCRCRSDDQGRSRISGGAGGLSGAHLGGKSGVQDNRSQWAFRQGFSRDCRADPKLARHLWRDGLRHNPPLAICTLCTGELRVSKEHHRGVLRHLDGFMEYTGE